MNLEPTIERLRDWLASQPDLRAAYLFGSMHDGSASATSDVDLAVEACAALDAPRKAEIIAALGRLAGRPVDLVDLAVAGEPLLGHVLDGRRLLGSEARHAALLRRHLFDAADFMPYRRRILDERRTAWTGT